MIAFIDWQPNIDAFTLGSFNVRWYSLCWCVGLVFAYLIVQRLYKQQKIGEDKFEPLFFYCFLGVLIGARLGHCIFYEPQYYLTSGTGFLEMLIPFHLASNGKWIFTGYEGLASHGGTLGLIVALFIYWKKMKIKPWIVLDNIAIAVPITACMIRLGNLMNSEIIGKQTDVPWAFIFHTKDSLVNGISVPRHPAQLYEAIAYLVIFVIEACIYYKWYKSSRADGKALNASVFTANKVANPQIAVTATAVGNGFYFGLCLAAIFTFRFFIEFLKKEQVDFEEGMLLDMGQLLSIPFIILGIWCMVKAKRIVSVH
ncbi:MAG: prolipoprotein diacylglyceryl transferase [Bacteroidaceae bacterium]|nr:prolipoprotein diacylglyceryl transferase [Bacteroidaceae bacterium]